MWTDQALLKLSNKISYCRNNLFQVLRSEKNDLSDSTFRWTLYHLLQEQKIYKVDYDTYVISKPEILPMYRPSKTDFDRYWTRDCIVILDLISQAPLSPGRPHEIIVEKMLVDILAEKSMVATFSPSELPFVYENVMRSYQIDKWKMNRYAGRRGKAYLINKLRLKYDRERVANELVAEVSDTEGRKKADTLIKIAVAKVL